MEKNPWMRYVTTDLTLSIPWKMDNLYFLTVKIPRKTMYMDPPLAIYTHKDGIVSLMHCEEWNSVSFIRIEYSESSLK